MSSYAYGWQSLYFGKAEATYDTVSAFAATDALPLDDLKFEAAMDLKRSKAHQGHPDAQIMIPGRYSGKWTAVTEARSAAAGTAPRWGRLLKAAFGEEAIVGGTSVTYNLLGTAPGSLQLARYVGAGLYEVVTGAWVEQVDIESAGNGDAKLTFSGGFATYGWCYSTDVGTGGAAQNAATVPYATANKGNLGKNAVVQIGARTNGGSGYTITSVDDSATPPAVSISPVLEDAVVEGDDIKPLLPTPTWPTETIIRPGEDSFSLDGNSLGLIGGKLSIKTGIHPVDKESTSLRPSGLLRGEREVSGDFQVYYLDKTTAPYLGRAFASTHVTRAVIWRIGPSTAAKKITVTIPKGAPTVVPLDIPAAEETTVNIKLVQAERSSADHDAINIALA